MIGSGRNRTHRVPVSLQVKACDEGDEAFELRTLLRLLATTHAETLRRLDATERKLGKTLAELAKSRLRAG
jgi:hypothetical protein